MQYAVHKESTLMSYPSDYNIIYYMANVLFVKMSEHITVFIQKAQHAFARNNFTNVIASIQTVLFQTGIYFHALPNYEQFRLKANFIVFAADAHAYNAVAHLLLKQYAEALDSIETSLNYLPDPVFYTIKSAILCCYDEPEGAIGAILKSTSLVNRKDLGNECAVDKYKLDVYKLIVST